MGLRDAFVMALVGAAIVAPILFKEQFSLVSGSTKDITPLAAAASAMSGKGAHVGCNASCQNGVMRLVDAFSDYDDRKKGRDARDHGVNQKGLSVMSMIEAKVNSRPAFIAQI